MDTSLIVRSMSSSSMEDLLRYPIKHQQSDVDYVQSNLINEQNSTTKHNYVLPVVKTQLCGLSLDLVNHNVFHNIQETKPTKCLKLDETESSKDHRDPELSDPQEPVDADHILQYMLVLATIAVKKTKYLKLDETESSKDHRDPELSDPQEPVDADHILQYMLVLATIAATITYQAGLNPPGVIWQENTADGLHYHRAGDPIHEPCRYKPFLYFKAINATAFMASLVILILLLSNIFRTQGIKYSVSAAGSCSESDPSMSLVAIILRLSTIFSTQEIKYCALPAIILDLLGLIGAYADTSSSKSAPAVDEGHHPNRPIIKQNPREATWHVACGAAHHMTGNKSLLLTASYSPMHEDGNGGEDDDSILVYVVNAEEPLRVSGSGSVRTESIALDDVWYVPGLASNLVSTGQLARQGFAINLGAGGCRITRGDALVGTARFTEASQFELHFLKVASSM